MSGFVDVIVKIGDQGFNTDTPHIYGMDGGIASVMDGDEWKDGYQFSDNMRKVYGILRVDKSLKDVFRKASQQLNRVTPEERLLGKVDLLTARRHEGCFDLNDLVKIIPNGSDLIKKWRGGDIVSPIEMRGNSDLITKLKPSIDRDFSALKIDNNAFTSGTKTWGGAGTPDYADLNTLDLDLGTPFTGDVIARMDGDTTESVAVVTAQNADGNAFTVDSGNPHAGGGKSAGYTHTITQNSYAVQLYTTNASTMKYGQSYMVRSGAGQNNVEMLVMWYGGIIHDMYFNAGGYATGRGPWAGAGSTIYNCMSWGSQQMGLRLSNGAGSAKNVGVINTGGAGIGVDANSEAWVIDNVYAFNSATAFSNVASATGRNTASDDTTNENGDFSTGSGNQSSLTEADEIENDDTSADFGKALVTGSIYNLGNTNHESTEGMAEVTWDAVNPSIGSFQVGAASPAGPPVGTLSMMGLGR
jgi:hypothetical protein